MKQSELIKKRFYTCTYYVGNNPNLHKGEFYYDEFGYWCHEDNVMLMEVILEEELRNERL